MNLRPNHTTGEDATPQCVPEYPEIVSLSTYTGDPSVAIRLYNQRANDPRLSAVDEQIMRLCERYFASDDREREALRAMASRADSLHYFAHRMAVRAMRTQDVHCVRLGLLALSLEDLRSDFRDTLGRLAMLLHAAGYIQAEGAAMFEEVARVCSEKTANCIRGFLARSPEDQNLHAFLTRQSQQSGGVALEFGVEG